MGFRKIKARVKNCRGSGDDFVLAQFEDNYGDWQDTIKGLDDNEKEQVSNAFNAIEDGLGDSLLETKEVFLMTKSDLDPSKIHEFVVLLQGEYFEIQE